MLLFSAQSADNYVSYFVVKVEELSASAADKKQAKSTADPLETYCDDNPEADECRQEKVWCSEISPCTLQYHVFERVWLCRVYED